jgi:hypothetical protein
MYVTPYLAQLLDCTARPSAGAEHIGRGSRQSTRRKKLHFRRRALQFYQPWHDACKFYQPELRISELRWRAIHSGISQTLWIVTTLRGMKATHIIAMKSAKDIITAMLLSEMPQPSCGCKPRSAILPRRHTLSGRPETPRAGHLVRPSIWRRNGWQSILKMGATGWHIKSREQFAGYRHAPRLVPFTFSMTGSNRLLAPPRQFE